MYAPTANGATCVFLLRTRPKTTRSKPSVAMISPSQSPVLERSVCRDVHRGQAEHQVRQQHAGCSAQHLGDAHTRPARRGEDRRRGHRRAHDRIEVRAGDRADGEDDCDQRRSRRDRVFKERQPAVDGASVCAAMPEPTTAMSNRAVPMNSASSRRPS